MGHEEISSAGWRVTQCGLVEESRQARDEEGKVLKILKIRMLQVVHVATSSFSVSFYLTNIINLVSGSRSFIGFLVTHCPSLLIISSAFMLSLL